MRGEQTAKGSEPGSKVSFLSPSLRFTLSKPEPLDLPRERSRLISKKKPASFPAREERIGGLAAGGDRSGPRRREENMCVYIYPATHSLSVPAFGSQTARTHPPPYTAPPATNDGGTHRRAKSQAKEAHPPSGGKRKRRDSGRHLRGSSAPSPALLPSPCPQPLFPAPASHASIATHRGSTPRNGARRW